MTRLTAQEIEDLAHAFTDLADAVRDILKNTAIKAGADDAAALSDNRARLTTIAANLATQAAGLTFDETANAFALLHQATKGACEESRRINARADKITAFVGIVAAAIDLGASFASGNSQKVLQSAARLLNASNVSQNPDTSLP